LAETTRILIRRLSLTMTTMRMIVMRKDSLTVFSGFINRIAYKLQQVTVESQVVYFFRHGVLNCIRSVCTAVGLNEKRRLAQEHRLNLSEFKGNCKWIWST